MDVAPERIHVLYVGHDAGFAEFLEGEVEHFVVTVATSASDGFEDLDANDVDCVVSDHDLPGADGLDVLETVREDYPDLPFVLFAEERSEEAASDAISAGATDYVPEKSGADQYAVVANRIENAVASHRTERDLNALRRRFELVTNASADAFWDWDLEADEVTRSEGYMTQFGYDESAVSDDVDWWFEALHPVDRNRLREAIDRALEEPETEYDETYRLRMGDGTYGYVHSRGHVVYDDGRPVRMVGAHTDITERMRREDALGALHDATRKFQNAPDKQTIADHAVETARTVLGLQLNGVWLYDDAEHVLRPVAGTAESEELLGELPVFADGDSFAWEAFETGEAMVFEDIQNEPGRYNPDTPIRSEIVLPVGNHGVMIVGSPEEEAFDDVDVSLSRILVETAEAAMERAEREQEIRIQRRELERQNERLDEFASVLSHDLRNPLNVATGRLHLGREECDNGHLDAVESALDRIAEIVERTLTLARSGQVAGEVETVDLSELVASCWQNVATARAEVRIENLPRISADPDRVRHLFENLFRNAVEHGGDDVTVRVGAIGDEGFSVEDDGPGIPEAARGDVFEPGYTTTEHGTGLGLNIVNDIVRAHGWEIATTEGEGGGARFEITGVDGTE